MGWMPFWFDTNETWGRVASPEAWAPIRERWEQAAALPSGAVYQLCRSNDATVGQPGRLPSFGQRIEHLGGRQTLGEFFDQHGMLR